MKLHEAVNSSEPDDRIVNEKWARDFKQSGWEEVVLHGACALSNEWQIIPTKPNVKAKGTMFKRTTRTYCIISDVEINSHDTYVRLYWTGSYWADDIESSDDYINMDAAKHKAQKVKDSYPMASVQLLSIWTESEGELIDTLVKRSSSSRVVG